MLNNKAKVKCKENAYPNVPDTYLKGFGHCWRLAAYLCLSVYLV
jgi:hypothetical protein